MVGHTPYKKAPSVKRGLRRVNDITHRIFYKIAPENHAVFSRVNEWRRVITLLRPFSLGSLCNAVSRYFAWFFDRYSRCKSIGFENFHISIINNCENVRAFERFFVSLHRHNKTTDATGSRISPDAHRRLGLSFFRDEPYGGCLPYITSCVVKL